MQELSMHLLDIAENSVKAGADLIEIALILNEPTGFLTISVKDNGCGMSAETVARVTDPFYTSRTTRRVGLGIPLLKQAAQLTDGDVAIESAVDVGTTVTATFRMGHIDLMPLGDMAGTMATLIQCNPDIDFVLTAKRDDLSFAVDTREMRALLGEVPLSDPQVYVFIKDYLNENLSPILQQE